MEKKLKRDAQRELEDWLDLPSRSPLLIFGPRQVGKSTLAKDFARKHFKDRILEINFYKDTRSKRENKKFYKIFSINTSLPIKTKINKLKTAFDVPAHFHSFQIIFNVIFQKVMFF